MTTTMTSLRGESPMDQDEIGDAFGEAFMTQCAKNFVQAKTVPLVSRPSDHEGVRFGHLEAGRNGRPSRAARRRGVATGSSRSSEV